MSMPGKSGQTWAILVAYVYHLYVVRTGQHDNLSAAPAGSKSVVQAIAAARKPSEMVEAIVSTERADAMAAACSYGGST